MSYIKKLILPLIILTLSILVQTGLNIYSIEQKVVHNAISKLSIILIIFSISWIIIALIRVLKINFLRRYDLSIQDNLQSRKIHTQFNILERILIFIIILLALGVVLLSFKSLKNIGVSLFASAGLAGIIIGLAAQKVIGSILAGVQIAITQPIRLDDVVIVENEWGWIEEITLTYVVVRIWDKRRLVLPSTYFIEEPFENWTRKSSDILGTIYVYTDYTIPFDALRKELTRLLESTTFWDKNVNVMQVTNATENTVEIRALVSAKDSPTAWNLRVYVREGLIKFIQENYPASLPRTRIQMEGENKKSEGDE